MPASCLSHRCCPPAALAVCLLAGDTSELSAYGGSVRTRRPCTQIQCSAGIDLDAGAVPVG